MSARPSQAPSSWPAPGMEHRSVVRNQVLVTTTVVPSRLRERFEHGGIKGMSTGGVAHMAAPPRWVFQDPLCLVYVGARIVCRPKHTHGLGRSSHQVHPLRGVCGCKGGAFGRCTTAE